MLFVYLYIYGFRTVIRIMLAIKRRRVSI